MYPALAQPRCCQQVPGRHTFASPSPLALCKCNSCAARSVDVLTYRAKPHINVPHQPLQVLYGKKVVKPEDMTAMIEELESYGSRGKLSGLVRRGNTIFSNDA